jgi:hypothetical protein
LDGGVDPAGNSCGAPSGQTSRSAVDVWDFLTGAGLSMSPFSPAASSSLRTAFSVSLPLLLGTYGERCSLALVSLSLSLSLSNSLCAAVVSLSLKRRGEDGNGVWCVESNGRKVRGRCVVLTGPTLF